MKYSKLTSIILSASMLSAACFELIPSHIYADAVSENITVDDMCFAVRNENSDELILTSYNGIDTALTIPEKVDGKTVTAIGDKVFSANNIISTVSLPDTINYFGSDVFRDSSVISVNIPKSLRVIPSYTFNNCQELETVSFHDDIAIIANTAFKKTNISVPQELRECVTGDVINSSDASCQFMSEDWRYNIISKGGSVRAEIVSYLGSESDVTVPSKLNNADVTACGEKNFPDINAVKSVVFPDTMTSLDIRFAGTEIEEIVVRGVKDIPVSEFENCTKLRKVTLAEKADSYTIGSKAFKNCISLESVSYPVECNKLSIESSAFENTGLKHLTLMCSSDLGSDAFAKCESLLTAELTDANVSPRAFMDCTALTDMTFRGETILSDLSVFCCDSLENVSFTDLKLESYNAFRNCPKLYTIDNKEVFNSETGDFITEYRDFIFTHFNGSDNVGFINDYVLAQVNRIVKENTDDSMTDIEKVLVLHDWVCNKTKYTEGNTGDRENHNDASVFMNEFTVCEGYARACNLLYHAAGIETYYVRSSDHAWNIVNIEGQYFHVDATWDDTEPISRQWFLKSDDELRKAGGSHSDWSLNVPSPLHDFQSDTLHECKYRMGDVNADGNIGVADLVTLQNHLLGRSKLEKDNWILSDMSYDGKINVFDMVLLRKAVITELS